MPNTDESETMQEQFKTHPRTVSPLAVRVPLLAALAIGSVPIGTASAQLPNIPPLWYTGDTHVHSTFCLPVPPTGPLPPVPDDITYDVMKAENINVASILIWNGPHVQAAENFDSYWVPLVNDTQSTFTQNDPNYWIQYDLEVGFSASPSSGHGHAMNLKHATFDQAAEWQTPIFKDLRAQSSDVITGYAHMAWPEDESFPPVGPMMAYHSTFMAAPHAAMRLLDYLETVQVDHQDPLYDFEVGHHTYVGLYYKILGSGFRPTLVGGTDFTCNSSVGLIGETRTYAQLESNPLTYDKWTAAIRDGRTTVSDGKEKFVRYTLNGQPIGSQVELVGPGTVDVEVTVSVPESQATQDVVEVIANAEILHSEVVIIPQGGDYTFTATIPLQKSSWIAVRAKDLATCHLYAHSSASYVIIEDRPVRRQEDAQYWVDYCTYLISNLGNFTSVGPQTALEMSAYISEARKIYEAIVELDEPAVVGTQTFGLSTPCDDSPMAIGVKDPIVAGGSPFRVTCLNAPSNAVGALVVGVAQDPTGYAGIIGVPLYINIFAPFFALPAVTNDGGYAEVSTFLPPASKDVPRYGQFVFINPKPWQCNPGYTFSASNAVELVAQ